ncbi:MAG: DUF904 domain-containing protein [Gammaproteobacteria bacterium]
MKAESPSLRLDLDIERLRARLDSLISHCGNLEDQLAELRGRQTELEESHAKLMSKNDEARKRVEGMIARLKALEVDS